MKPGLAAVVAGVGCVAGCAGLLGIEDGEYQPDALVDSAAVDSTAVEIGVDTAVTDTDTSVADTSVADTSVADTSIADTSVADTSVADTSVADTSVADTSVADTGLVAPKSCAASGAGRTDCGGSGAESCCTSLPVSGVSTASFSRSYDGVTSGYTDSSYKAQVSDFRLDKYEITVGRFRQYVAAVVGGWTPVAASGKHTHLTGGGLNGGAEAGWDATWTTSTNFPTSKSTWDTNLSCHTSYSTWTSSPAGNEKRPINCISWYDAAAFCIWDGGFLPSEAEWNYAASGGTEHRTYPWGGTTPGADATLAVYGCYYGGAGGTCPGVTSIAPVGSAPAGNGKYGQSDLAGNLVEWVMDWYKSPYNETVCTNCSYLVSSSTRVRRGSNFIGTGIGDLLASYRNFNAPSIHNSVIGARCARPPS